MSELLPCPFCGSAEVSHSMGEKGDGTPWPYVECDECSAMAEPEFWNRRALASKAVEPRPAYEVRSDGKGGTGIYRTEAVEPRLTAEAMARRFHETYERLAPQFGYETRPETRAFDPESLNGRLMIAVCASLTPSPEPRLTDAMQRSGDLTPRQEALFNEIGDMTTNGRHNFYHSDLFPLFALILAYWEERGIPPEAHLTAEMRRQIDWTRGEWLDKQIASLTPSVGGSSS